MNYFPGDRSKNGYAIFFRNQFFLQHLNDEHQLEQFLMSNGKPKDFFISSKK